MAPATKKPTKAAGAKKAKGKGLPPVPRHASDPDALLAYMSKQWKVSLKVCLEALDGGNDLEVSEALSLISHHMVGNKAATTEISTRLESATARKEHAKAAAAVAAAEEAAEGNDNLLPGTDGVTGENPSGFDVEKWLIPHLERTIEGAMQDRFQWSTLRGPAEELAARLLEEAERQEEQEPLNGIVPGVPDEDSFLSEMLAMSAEDAVLKTSDLVQTGSLLLLETFQLDSLDLEGSAMQFQDMVATESRTQQEACSVAAGILLTAIKRQRRMNGELTANDRERVSVAIDTIKAVVTNAANDVVGYVSGVKGNLEVYCAAKSAEEALQAVAQEDPPEERAASSEEGKAPRGAEAEADARKQQGEADAGNEESDPPAEGDAPAANEESSKPEQEPEAASSDGPPASAEATTAASAGDQLLKQMDDLAAQVLSVAEDAIAAMEENVEVLLFDRGGDMAAMIAKEERAVVNKLGLLPWQAKVAATRQTLLDGIQHVLRKLEDYSNVLQEGPAACSKKGKAVQARPPPTFEVLTLLISATCHCLGDTERALGIGLQAGQKEDLEALDDIQKSVENAEDTHPEGLGFRESMLRLRLGAARALEEAIRRMAVASKWNETEGAAPDSLPVRLLLLQLNMCMALQRLQSRLMCSLKSMQLLPTVIWDEVSLEVLGYPAEETSLDTSQPGVQEIAAVIPFLKAGKALHTALTATWPDGEPKIIDWLPFASSHVAELERCCRHLAQEIEGYAEQLDIHVSDKQPETGNTQGVQAGTPLESMKVGLGETDGDEALKRDIMGHDEPLSSPTATALDTSELAETKGDTTMDEEELEAAAARALQQDIDAAQDGDVSMAEAELEEAAQDALLADIEQESRGPDTGQAAEQLPFVRQGAPPGQMQADVNEVMARKPDEVSDEVMQVLKMVTAFSQSLKLSVSGSSG